MVVAAGIRPRIALARDCGLRCDRGVLVDDTLQTFDPAIYAVGECVQHRGSTYGLVAPLWEQARVCAAHLSEHGGTRYRGSMPATQLKVTGIDLFSAGDIEAGPGTETLRFADRGSWHLQATAGRGQSPARRRAVRRHAERRLVRRAHRDPAATSPTLRDHMLLGGPETLQRKA